MKLFIFLLLFAGSSQVLSALPPWIQAEKDRDAMDKYIHEHSEMSGQIQYIDYENYIIYLDNGCRLIFEREQPFHPPQWVGPAAPLIMDREECGDSFAN